MNKNIQHFRGLQALVTDAIEHGTKAIEQVHLRTAKRTFDVLEEISPIADPSKQIHNIHDNVVANVYSTIRSVNQLVGKTIESTLEQLDTKVSGGSPSTPAPTSEISAGDTTKPAA